MTLSKRGLEMKIAREAMEFAQRNGCSVIEAKRRIANINRARHEDFLAKLASCGTVLRQAQDDRANEPRSSNSDLIMNEKPQPWMMRD